MPRSTSHIQEPATAESRAPGSPIATLSPPVSFLRSDRPHACRLAVMDRGTPELSEELWFVRLRSKRLEIAALKTRMACPMHASESLLDDFARWCVPGILAEVAQRRHRARRAGA